METSNSSEKGWSSTATIRKTREKALENGNGIPSELLDQEFVDVADSIKQETKQENGSGLTTENGLHNEQADEIPVNYDESYIRFIDDFMDDEEEIEDEMIIPDNENSQKSKCKSKTESETNLMCVVINCTKGNVPFKTAKELKNHHKEEHSGQFCNKCNSVSNSEADFVTHNCNKRYKCKVCQRLFSTSHELKSHSYIHSGEKPHMCDFCGKGFRQRATLDRHKLTHESKRNYDCDICLKKFKFKHYLVSHKLLHSGVKPHMCTWCGMRFAQNANMQKHIRQQHTHEKAHVCKYCGKGWIYFR